MCLTPITIPNPNYHSKVKLIQQTKNVSDSRIEVPCGHCPQCRSRKQSDWLQRVQMESLRSHIYMFTLTYNQAHLPVYELESGVTLCHPNYKHLTDMFKRIRRRKYFGDRYMKYLVCSEYGKKGRVHYHGLLFLEKLDSDTKFTHFALEPLVSKTILSEWRVNVATRALKKDCKRGRKGELVADNVHPVYEPLCTYISKYINGQHKSTFDCHAVTAFTAKGANDVSFYVTKYLFKDSSYVKYIKKCCFECYPDDPNMAMMLFNDIFKCFNKHSLNFGNVWTQDSFNDYRKSHCDLSLEYSPDYEKYLLRCVRMSRSMNQPIEWFDLYTGKFLPICKYFLDSLSSEDQVYHYQQLILNDVRKPFDIFRTKVNIQKLGLSERVKKRSDKPDLFDYDSLFT